MIAQLFSALTLVTSPDASCPSISLGELQPSEGEEFVYSFWRDEHIQPGSYRIEIVQPRDNTVRAEESYFLATGQWTPRSTLRAVAGIILINENEFDGTFPRQVTVRSVNSEIMARGLAEGDEVRVPVIETAEVTSGDTQRHEGEYVISHAGCGELIHEGETIRTRRLRAEYSRFIGQPEAGWTLTQVVQIYHVPVGANWFYAQHREENHPMQQSTMMEGYTAP